jgi:hypothetical protein
MTVCGDIEDSVLPDASFLKLESEKVLMKLIMTKSDSQLRMNQESCYKET